MHTVRKPSARRARQSGFVLATTLWFIAITAIAIAYFAERVSRAVESADKAQRMTNALVDIASTRSDILYRLATTPVSQTGLGANPLATIHLDDTPYKGLGNDIVSLQDNSGLVNINFGSRQPLAALLTSYGIKGEKLPQLFDALEDAMDEDDLRRLNGAEKPEYEAIGLPPPPNTYFLSPTQLRSTYGWSQLTSLWADGRFLSLLTTARSFGFTPSTAPRDVLALLTPADPRLADTIHAMRQTDPIKAELMALGLARSAGIDDDSVRRVPSNNVRLTQSSPDLPWAVQLNIMPTPGGSVSPWRFDYSAKTQVKSVVSDVTTLVQLPPVDLTATVAPASSSL